MSQQEKPLNVLTPFEAALAALTPRVQAFDRERLIFLAGQAAALRERDVPLAAAKGTVPFLLRQKSGQSPAGGTPASRGRWAWPAAFSAMTAVAASLLVMLCSHAGPMVASAGVEPKNTAVNVAGTRRVPESGTQPASGRPVPDATPDAMPDWLAIWLSPSMAPTQPAEKAADVADAAFADSDPALRAELRRHGMDFRRSRGQASSDPIVVAEAPLPYYQLLERLQGKAPAGQGGMKEMMQ